MSIDRVGVIGAGQMGSGIAANPFLQFFTVAEASGEFEFEWVDDSGDRGMERARITVE